MNKKYTQEFIESTNELKKAVLAFTCKVELNEDASVEFGTLYRTISENWKKMDATLFPEEYSILPPEIEAAYEQSYRI